MVDVLFWIVFFLLKQFICYATRTLNAVNGISLGRGLIVLFLRQHFKDNKEVHLITHNDKSHTSSTTERLV